MRFIGDVHGKWRRYRTIIADCPASIQVGDFGVGFIDPMTQEYSANPPFDAMTKGDHRFIRGNHDNPTSCTRHSRWIADGTVEDDIMYIGGAFSIDREWRTEGYTWWPEEELSYGELQLLTDKYLEVKPRIMVTHTCPEVVITSLFPISYKSIIPSRTQQALQGMWEAHKPDFWIFGHWHYSADKTILGTRFICLDELEYLDFDLRNTE